MRRLAVRRGLRFVVALGALLTLAATPITAPDARARTFSSTFLGHVDADGVNIRVEGQGLPLASVIDASPWAATVRVNNIQSLGQAGIPYLGDFITPLLGTINGLGGGGTNLPPMPTAPGYVASSYPNTPTASSTNAGFLISATSEAARAESHVQVGAPPVGGQGNSTVFANASSGFSPDGVLTASSEAGVLSLSIGGVIEIGKVSSFMSVTDDGAGAPKISVNTGVEAATVLGIPIGIDETGVSVLGAQAPLSQSLNKIVNDALSKLGVTLRLASSSQVVDPKTGQVTSVSSGTLQIGLATTVPGLGKTSVTLTVGRASIEFLNRPFPAATPRATSAQSTPIAPSMPPATGSISTSGTVSSRGSGSGGSALPPTASTPRGGTAAATGPIDGPSFTGLYLVLVLAALALVGPATLLERAGLLARKLFR